MIAPLWRGADRIVLVCEAEGSPHALRARMCEAAGADLRADAPWSVVGSDVAGATRRGDLVFTLMLGPDGGEIGLRIKRAITIDDAEGYVARRAPIAGADDAALANGIARVFDAALPWRSRRRAG